MASTNKTANLHLNQWTADDPVLREDFNADNAAIDAAFSNMLYSKLREVTLSQGAQAVELDLSGIDPDDYAELQIFMELKAAANDTQPDTIVYFDTETTTATHVMNAFLYGTNSLSGNAKTTLIGNTSDNATMPPSMWVIRLQASPVAGNGFRIVRGSWDCASYHGAAYAQGGIFTLYANTFTKMVVKKLYAGNGYSADIAAGSKIKVYGVRK